MFTIITGKVILLGTCSTQSVTCSRQTFKGIKTPLKFPLIRNQSETYEKKTRREDPKSILFKKGFSSNGVRTMPVDYTFYYNKEPLVSVKKSFI